MNNIINIKNDQKSPSDELVEAHEIINQDERRILEEVTGLGYISGSLEQFVMIDPDIDEDQERANKIISLQNNAKELLQKKELLDNTILVEPSKLHEAIASAEKLLKRQLDRRIFQRGGKLVQVISLSFSPQEKSVFTRRASDAVIIREIDQVYLTVLLTERGNFLRVDRRSGNIVKIDCPEKIARCLLAKYEWDIPILTGIINAPTLRRDGSIIDIPGYDCLSGMLFLPGNESFSSIPINPTDQQVAGAKEKLLYVLKDFPFEGEASKSVALAAILTSLVRKSLATAPLFGFTAPKMASGKSLLADIVSLIATGKHNSVLSQAESDAEEKKRILAVLIEGDPIICFDNIEKPFGSAALCAVLTQQEYKDRLLGGSETRTVLTNATFLATGNNLTFVGDTTTRALLCKLDPQVERPEERTFEVNLNEYIPKNRGELVVAGLTIVRAYFVAGLPQQKISPFGRFEEWSNIIRSAIVWIGMSDPCESRKGIEDADPVRMLLGALLESWYEIFKDRSLKIKELIAEVMRGSTEAHMNLKEILFELAPDNKEGISVRTLAKKFQSFINRIENKLRLEQGKMHQGTNLWLVRKMKD